MKPIAEVQFPPVRLGRGYDMLEVDRFLDKVAAAPKETWPALVREARFATVFIREGYEMESVDAYLAELAAEGAPAKKSKSASDLSAGLREDAHRLKADWDAIGLPQNYYSTVSSKPFEAPPEELLALMEKKANDTLAGVIVQPREKELADMVLQLVGFYRSMRDAIEGFDNISLKTSPLKASEK